MTHHDPLDDLASAHLDGATTPEEAARVQADPSLSARVEALRLVRTAMAATAPPDGGRREQAIAAALMAYDEDRTVTPLTPVVSRHRGPAQRSWRVASVAAAVAALAALVPLLASLSSGSDDSANTAASGGTALEDSRTAQLPSAAVDAEAGLQASSTTMATRENRSLGSFASDEALVRAIPDTSADATPGEAFSAGLDSNDCVATLLAELDPAALPATAATATVAGKPVVLVITIDEVRITGGDCTDVRILSR